MFTLIAGVLGAKAFDRPPLENRLIDLYHGEVGTTTQRRITGEFANGDCALV